MRNKNLNLTLMFALLIAILWNMPSFAINSKAGTAAYTFLKIGPGARSQAMAGAYVGLSDDESALYYNPAGLTVKGESYELFDDLLDQQTGLTNKNHFTATYIDYLMDIQFGFVGYIREIDESSKMGVSITYQDYGTFNELNESGDKTGTFSSADMAFAATYSKRVEPWFNVGLTGKFIYEKIDENSSNGLAIDIGLMYLINEKGTSRVGLSLTNLGVQLSGLTESHKDPLPTKVALGMSHHLKGLPFLFAGEIGKPYDNDFYLSLGMELLSLDPFFVRVGWTSASKDQRVGGDNDTFAGFSGGFGLKHQAYTIDYSYSSLEELGNIHRISFGVGF